MRGAPRLAPPRRGGRGRRADAVQGGGRGLETLVLDGERLELFQPRVDLLALLIQKFRHEIFPLVVTFESCQVITNANRSGARRRTPRTAPTIASRGGRHDGPNREPRLSTPLTAKSACVATRSDSPDLDFHQTV